MSTTVRNVAILLTLSCSNAIGFLFPTTCSPATATYDYIIVGGGSAGCVLAARLSENPTTKVLLLEAGGDPLPWATVPGLAPLLQHGPMDWEYLSEPQANTGYSFNQNRVAIPRGKALGGSSSINYMVYHRGNPKDYDLWNIDGWRWTDLKQYFIDAENASAIPQFASAAWHGKTGPLKTSWTARSTLTSAFLEASASAGVTQILDYNDPTTDGGISYEQQTAFSGIRQSTYETYLKAALGRSNLVVQRYTFVEKLLTAAGTNGGPALAKGVQYSLLNLLPQYVCARKEVIVAAGAINSPKLLQLSGIGKLEDLNTIGVVRASGTLDLPVGRGLRDHVMVNIPFTYNTSIGILQPDQPLNLTAVLANVYTLTTSLSPSLQNTIVDGNAQIRTIAGLDRPDIQFQIVPVGLMAPLQLPLIMHYTPDAATATYGSQTATPSAILQVILLHQSNTGWVRANGTDVTAKPKIDPKFLETPADVDTLVRGIKLALKFTESAALAKYNFKPSERAVQGCPGAQAIPLAPVAVADFTDDYIRCIIRQRADSAYHPKSTCSMGTNPATSVVTPSLKVHGFSNLRVIDASIFPGSISGNTNAAVIAIAEKAAYLIKNGQ